MRCIHSDRVLGDPYLGGSPPPLSPPRASLRGWCHPRRPGSGLQPPRPDGEPLRCPLPPMALLPPAQQQGDPPCPDERLHLLRDGEHLLPPAAHAACRCHLQPRDAGGQAQHLSQRPDCRLRLGVSGRFGVEGGAGGIGDKLPCTGLSVALRGCSGWRGREGGMHRHQVAPAPEIDPSTGVRTPALDHLAQLPVLAAEESQRPCCR